MFFIHNRLKNLWDNRQSFDQFGFRPSLGVEYALILNELWARSA